VVVPQLEFSPEQFEDEFNLFYKGLKRYGSPSSFISPTNELDEHRKFQHENLRQLPKEYNDDVLPVDENDRYIRQLNFIQGIDAYKIFTVFRDVAAYNNKGNIEAILQKLNRGKHHVEDGLQCYLIYCADEKNARDDTLNQLIIVYDTGKEKFEGYASFTPSHTGEDSGCIRSADEFIIKLTLYNNEMKAPLQHNELTAMTYMPDKFLMDLAGYVAAKRFDFDKYEKRSLEEFFNGMLCQAKSYKQENDVNTISEILAELKS
jgi:hypothetical protein